MNDQRKHLCFVVGAPQRSGVSRSVAGRLESIGNFKFERFHPISEA